MTTMTANIGEYTLTGIAANLEEGLNAESGVYSLTGLEISFNPMFAGSGVYSLTGTKVGFNPMPAASGAYFLTGSNLNFIVDAPIKPQGTLIFFMTLSGSPEIDIIIKTFQAKLRQDEPTYLEIVTPEFELLSQINTRQGGDLKVDMAYILDGEVTNRETIIEVILETIRVDEGSSNKSITLTGHSTTLFTKKSITLYGSTYKRTKNGLIRYRFSEPDVYLKPGDEVTVENDKFIANVISYFVGGKNTTMEVAEA